MSRRGYGGAAKKEFGAFIATVQCIVVLSINGGKKQSLRYMRGDIYFFVAKAAPRKFSRFRECTYIYPSHADRQLNNCSRNAE